VVVAKFGVDPALGLTTSAVQERLDRYGANALQKIRPRSAWRILVDQFASIVVALLGAAAAVAWITNDVLEAVAILVVLVINGLVGFLTEWQADRSLDAPANKRRQLREFGAAGLKQPLMPGNWFPATLSFSMLEIWFLPTRDCLRRRVCKLRNPR
jgi:hypothetical protein